MQGVAPRLFVVSGDEESLKVSLRAASTPRAFVARITGGCGGMSAADASGMIEIFRDAFRGYDGAVICGGTRMVLREDVTSVVPGITEVAPAIREVCPKAIVLGIVPRTGDLNLEKFGLEIATEGENPFHTIVHPEQDLAVIIQRSVDRSSPWEAEVTECVKLIGNLREYANRRSVLITYNGGKYTEMELLMHANRGWPVIVIAGSGRKSSEYAENMEFLLAHPNVKVVPAEALALREALTDLGAFDKLEGRGGLTLTKTLSA